MSSHVEEYLANGYAVLKGVFNNEEVMEIAGEFDRLKMEARKHPKSYRHQNVLYMIREDPEIGSFLQFLQWPSYISPILQKYRVEKRLLRIVEPLIGNDLKQIINQCFWKPPGSSNSTFAFHQDCRFRRPADAYRALATSYIQTGIAIDPHHQENGCMRVYPGSHLLGDLKLALDRGVMVANYDEQKLMNHGLKPELLADVILDPGDVAIWGPYTLHGSGPNQYSFDRRFYVNGYVTASNCDRGEWAFRNGDPCELGEPLLIQFEELFSRPEPHYIDGPAHPYSE